MSGRGPGRPRRDGACGGGGSGSGGAAWTAGRVVACVVCLGACAQDVGGDAARADGALLATVRVATWNVRRLFDVNCDSGACGQGDYEDTPPSDVFDLRCADLADAIRATDADVVLLQEVETALALEGVAVRLMDRLPYRTLGETGGAASLDVGVLSRFPIARSLAHAYPPDAPPRTLRRPDGTATRFSRELLEARLDVDGLPVHVFTVHFRSQVDDDPGRRLAEAQATAEVVAGAAAARQDALVVLGGDMNDVPGSPPLAALIDAGLQLVDAGASYVFDGAPVALDHLLYGRTPAGSLRPGTAGIVANAPAGGAGPGLADSDHAAVVAAFDLRGSVGPGDLP